MPLIRRLVRPAVAPAFVVGALLLAACGDSSGPNTPRVSSVAVAPPTANVVVNTTLQLSATPRSADGAAISGKTVTWSSLNNAIATVTAQGLVTGVGSGTVQINAAVDGISGSATITVGPPPVTSVTISPAAPAVSVGGTLQLTAVLRDGGNNVLTGRTVAWSSQNTSVATINATTGLVQGCSAWHIADHSDVGGCERQRHGYCDHAGHDRFHLAGPACSGGHRNDHWYRLQRDSIGATRSRLVASVHR